MTPRGTGRVLAALLLSCAMGGAFAQDDPKIYRQAANAVKKGSEALQANDLDGARAQFEAALHLVPWLAEAHLGLGHIAMRAQRWDAALVEYQAAEKGYREAADRRSRAEFQRYFDARSQENLLRDELNQSQNTNVKMSEGRRNQLAVTGESRVDDARRAALPTAAASTVVPAEVYFLVGNAQFRLDRMDEAQASWEECVKVDPAFPPVYNNLALAYFKAGRMADARFALDRAEALGIKVNPKFRAAVDQAVEKVKPIPGT